MSSPLTASQKAASALRRAEIALRNWQDDPNSPRSDVDKMLAIVADLRDWTQGHVLADIEPAHTRGRAAVPGVAEAGEAYEHWYEDPRRSEEEGTEPGAFSRSYSQDTDKENTGEEG